MGRSNLPPGVSNHDLEPPESALDVAVRSLDFADIGRRWNERIETLELIFSSLCEWVDDREPYGHIIIEEFAALFTSFGLHLSDIAVEQERDMHIVPELHTLVDSAFQKPTVAQATAALHDGINRLFYPQRFPDVAQ